MTWQRWRPSLPGGLIAASLVALLCWLVAKTEWVEKDVSTPLAGKAASDDHYVLKSVLQTIGVRIEERADLSQLPPPDATLLLSDWNWDLLPERTHAVNAWVEQGGHLVIEVNLLISRARSASWIPIDLVFKTPAAAKSTGPVPKPSDRPPGLRPECRRVGEPDGVAPAYPDGAAKHFSLCIAAGPPLSTRATPLWALASEDGNDVLRVGLGSGSVTVVPGWGFGWTGADISLFGNARLLTGDNALVVVAALQARPGAEVWLVSGRGGQPLLAWLWSRAHIALALALLALSLWLWRASARFGPIEASPPLARRSMSEQIAGTASFLWRRRPEALHAAQVRALDEAATVRVRQYDRLDLVDRAAAIAAATDVGRAVLVRALNPAASHSADGLARVLTALETARRRLLELAHRPVPPSSRSAGGTEQQEASR